MNAIILSLCMATNPAWADLLRDLDTRVRKQATQHSQIIEHMTRLEVMIKAAQCACKCHNTVVTAENLPPPIAPAPPTQAPRMRIENQSDCDIRTIEINGQKYTIPPTGVLLLNPPAGTVHAIYGTKYQWRTDEWKGREKVIRLTP